MLLTVLITCLTGLLFGFDSGIISGAIFIIKQRFILDAEETQLLIDAMLFGACAGSLLGGKFADYYGRRSILLLVAYIFIIGSICSALSLNTNWLTIGRLIIGVAIGLSSFIAPLYIAEITPKAHRGKLILLNNIAISLGMALAYIVTFYLNSEEAWRTMLVISIFPAVLLGFGILILPESPCWLAQQGWLQDAKQVLSKLRNNAPIEEEWKEMQLMLKKQANLRWNSRSNKVWPVLLLGICLALAEQTTGIDTILYYVPAIFEAAGFRGASIPIASFKIEIMGLLIAVATSFLVDRVGRRKLVLTGFSIMLSSLLILAAIFPLCLQHLLPPDLLMADLLLFIIGCFFSLGTLFWLIMAEIFPLKLRGLLMGMVVALNWATVLYVTSDSFGILEHLSPVLTLWSHIAICVLSLVIFYFFLPETKNASLSIIENNVLSGKSLRELGSSS